MDSDVYKCTCGYAARRAMQCPICRHITRRQSSRLLRVRVPQLCGVIDVAVILVWGPPSHGKSTLCRIACRYFDRPAYIAGEERTDRVRAGLEAFGAGHTTVNPPESKWSSFDFLVFDSLQTIEYDSAKAWAYPPHVLVNQVNAEGLAHGGMTVRHWCDADLMTQATLNADGLPTGRYEVVCLKDRGGRGRPSWRYSLPELYGRTWPAPRHRRSFR